MQGLRRGVVPHVPRYMSPTGAPQGDGRLILGAGVRYKDRYTGGSNILASISTYACAYRMYRMSRPRATIRGEPLVCVRVRGRCNGTAVPPFDCRIRGSLVPIACEARLAPSLALSVSGPAESAVYLDSQLRREVACRQR